MLLIPACPSGALDQGAVGRARNISSALAGKGPAEHKEIYHGSRGDYLVRVAVPVDGEPTAYVVALFQEMSVVPGEGAASYLTVAGGMALIQIGITGRYTGGAIVGGSCSIGQELNVFGLGGAVAGGLAARYREINTASNGGSVAGGRGEVSRGHALAGKSGAVAGGRALASRSMNKQGKGGAVIGGRCLVSIVWTEGVSGGGIAGGRSIQSQNVLCHSRGGAVAGGRAFLLQTRLLQGKGGVVVSGRSRVLSNDAQLARGGAVVGGRSGRTAEVIVLGRGGIVAGGALSRGGLHSARGGSVAGGKAFPARVVVVRAKGGVIAGGKVSSVFENFQMAARGGAVAGGKSVANRFVTPPVSGGIVAGGRYKPGSVSGIHVGSGGVVAGGRASMISRFVAKFGKGGGVTGSRAAMTEVRVVFGRGGALAGGHGPTLREQYFEPTIEWATPVDIPYLTPLSETQLNAVAKYDGAKVEGSYQYDPPLGTVLQAGGPYSITVWFTPLNLSKYVPVGKEVWLTVTKIPQTTSVDATFGLPRNENWEVFIPLGATCTVQPTGGNGTGAYVLEMAWVNDPQNTGLIQNPLGLAGNAVTPVDGFGEGISLYRKGDRNYLDSDYVIVCYAIVVAPGTLGVSWQQPADVEPGTALTGAQLNAQAMINAQPLAGGTYTYNPVAGTVITQDTVLSVTFNHPAYGTAYASVLLRINRHELRIVADSTSRPYWSSNPGFTWHIEGLPPGVTMADLTMTGTPYLSTTAGISSDCGSYPIMVDVSGFAIAGYTLVPVSGTLLITKIDQAQLYYTITNISLPVGNQAKITGSGGSGTGEITYGTDFSNIISLNGLTGYFTGLTVGSYTIIIYKAGDTNHNPKWGYTAAYNVVSSYTPPPPPPPNTHTYSVLGQYAFWWYDDPDTLSGFWEEALTFYENGTVLDQFWGPWGYTQFLFTYSFDKLNGRGEIFDNTGTGLGFSFHLSYYSETLYVDGSESYYWKQWGG